MPQSGCGRSGRALDGLARGHRRTAPTALLPAGAILLAANTLLARGLPQLPAETAEGGESFLRFDAGLSDLPFPGSCPIVPPHRAWNEVPTTRPPGVAHLDACSPAGGPCCESPGEAGEDSWPSKAAFSRWEGGGTVDPDAPRRLRGEGDPELHGEADQWSGLGRWAEDTRSLRRTLSTLPLQTWVAPEPGDVACPIEEAAPPAEPTIDLVVAAGRVLRVALDQRTRLRRAGQEVEGTLIEPVYAYDRVVLPAGTKVIGHIEKLEGVSKGTRLRTILGGDFSPMHRAVLRFDILVFEDGKRVSISTQVDEGRENVSLRVAGASEKKGKIERARQEVAQRVQQALAPFKGPGRMERLKEYLVGRLPYHPQYLAKGTVFAAELLSPLSFGEATPTERAPEGTPAPPDSILEARLTTPLDSAKTPRATPVRAVLTRPLLSPDQRLILPEGTELMGQVTFAVPAARFHRNGQLRFLFETVQPPQETSRTLLASLYAAELSQGDGVAIDEEGGTTVTSSKARFIAPALAILATSASLDRGEDRDNGIPDPRPRSNRGGRGIAGYFGMGLFGSFLSQAARPLSVGLGVVGVVRTVWGAVLGKGQEVVIPANTSVQLQMSPASTAH